MKGIPLKGKHKGNGTRQFTHCFDYGWKIFQKIIWGGLRKLGGSPTFVRFPLWSSLIKLQPTRGPSENLLLPPPDRKRTRNTGTQNFSCSFWHISWTDNTERWRYLQSHHTLVKGNVCYSLNQLCTTDKHEGEQSFVLPLSSTERS